MSIRGSSLDYSGLSECCECAVFIDGLDRSGREGESDRFLKLRYIDFLWLEVYISAYFSGRVKLRRTSCV